MTRPRILILGAGSRVRDDLLPALVQIGFMPNELLLIRKSQGTLTEFPEFCCTQFDPGLVRSFNPDFVISCLPSEVTPTVVYELLQHCKPLALLVDTPVQENLEFLEGLNLPNGVSVMEDNHLVFFNRQLALENPRHRMLVLRNSFYNYHGIAFLRSALGTISKFRLKFRLRNFLLLVFFSGSTMILWIGPRNYQTGQIYSIQTGKLPQMLAKVEFKPFNLTMSEQEIVNRFLDSVSQEKVMRENPIRNMLFWKRVGLTLALNDYFFRNRNNFISLREAAINESFFMR